MPAWTHLTFPWRLRRGHLFLLFLWSRPGLQLGNRKDAAVSTFRDPSTGLTGEQHSILFLNLNLIFLFLR